MDAWSGGIENCRRNIEKRSMNKSSAWQQTESTSNEDSVECVLHTHEMREYLYLFREACGLL